MCAEMAKITCNCHNLRGKKLSSYLTCRVNLKNESRKKNDLLKGSFEDIISVQIQIYIASM